MRERFSFIRRYTVLGEVSYKSRDVNTEVSDLPLTRVGENGGGLSKGQQLRAG